MRNSNKFDTIDYDRRSKTFALYPSNIYKTAYKYHFKSDYYIIYYSYPSFNNILLLSIIENGT